MDFDLVQDLETTSLLFKVIVLLAVGAAYIIFEALSSRSSASSKGGRDSNSAVMPLELQPFAARAEQARLAIEAYRPISGWSTSKFTD